MEKIIDALYVTEWDDRETILESPCKVNLISHEITEIGERTIVQSPYDEDTLDDNIENLYDQYIEFEDGTLCCIVEYDEKWSFLNQGGTAPFYITKG